MKSFSLVQPKSLARAIALLDKGRDPAQRDRTRVLAGGQDLLTEMKEHLVEPEELVDLKGIAGLDRIAFDEHGDLSIGALCTITTLDEHSDVRARLRVLSEAAGSIASAQIRSQGTVGGNLCQRPRCWYYRDENAKCLKKGGSICFAESGLNKYNAIFGGGPSYIVHPSDLAPALVALGAEVTLESNAGARTVPLEQFFTLPSEGSILRENVLAAGEILTGVRVPAPAAGTRSTYLKFKERGSFDFALSSVAACLVMDGAKVVRARLVLGGVAPIPWRVTAAEKVLEGRTLDAALFDEVAAKAVSGARPLAQNAYKVPLTKGVIVRALQSLAKA